jgi:hypothetical protein
MIARLKSTSIQVVNDPNARAFFILGTLLAAVLVGGAPTDHTGS